MIKNIVFDIGNVLVDFRWRDFLFEKGFDEAMVERIAKASVNNPFWNEYDVGLLTADEVLNGFIKADPEIEEQLHKAFDSFDGMIGRREYAISWVESFKKAGYKVYYLSNFSKKAYDECIDTLDFIPHMDGGILSYLEHMIKPDKAIYELLLDRYNLKAEETVFLDDTEKNIIGARTVGINGIVHESVEKTMDELRSLGVKLNEN